MAKKSTKKVTIKKPAPKNQELKKRNHPVQKDMLKSKFQLVRQIYTI